MNTKKKTKAFIGASVSAFLIAVLLFLPVIPVVYAGTSSTTSSCANLATSPLNGFTTKDFNLIVRNITIGFSFAFSHYINGTTTDYWFPNGTMRANPIVHKHGVTNYTSDITLGTTAMRRANLSASSAHLRYLVNGSADSYLNFANLKVIMTQFNATILKESLTMSHLDFLVGPVWAKNIARGSSIPVGFPISFDNFKMTWFVNCNTGQINYGFAGTTNGISMGNIASAFMGHRLTGAVALPSFSEASR